MRSMETQRNDNFSRHKIELESMNKMQAEGKLRRKTLRTPKGATEVSLSIRIYKRWKREFQAVTKRYKK